MAHSTQTISANGTNTVSVTLNTVSATTTVGSGTSPVPLPTLQPATGSGSGVVGGSVNVTVPSNSGLSAGTTVTVGGVAPAQLTVQISSTQRQAQYTSGAGNTYVYGLNFVLNPSQTLSAPLQVGATLQVGSSLGALLSASGTLNVAQFNGTTYVDIGQVNYTYSAPTLTITGGSSGITSGTTSGVTYVIYLPPSNSTPAPSPSPSLSPTATPSTSPTLAPVNGVLNVYYMPVDGQTLPINVSAGDPATFNSSTNMWGAASPPPSYLLGNTTSFSGDAGDVSNSGYDWTAHPPSGVITAGCLGTFTYGATSCASNDTANAPHEWMAVQTWPFYVGASGTSNLTPGTYNLKGGADDAMWLVIAPSAFTYSQPGNFAGATGLVSGNAALNSSGSKSYGSPQTGSVTIAAGVGSANIYWVTMQYAELVGGQASSAYAWQIPGGSGFGTMTQGAVYGQVTVNGTPTAGISVSVTGAATGTVATDSNGYYGYNFTNFGSVMVSTSYQGATASAATTLSAGQATQMTTLALTVASPSPSPSPSPTVSPTATPTPTPTSS